MAEDPRGSMPEMDKESLYQEEVFTDRRVGTIQRLTPVDGDGAPDASRPVIYMGQTQVLTPAGALPLSFEIQAGSLSEAAENFSDAAQVAVEETSAKLEEMRREAASSIIVPEKGAPGGGPGGPGGFGGIQGV